MIRSDQTPPCTRTPHRGGATSALKPGKGRRAALGLISSIALTLGLATAPLNAQPLPQGVKAWLAQRALEGGDLPTAQRWKPAPDRPERALLRAAIELRSGFPAEALKSLESLTGQGAPRPLPGWRPRALPSEISARVPGNNRILTPNVAGSQLPSPAPSPPSLTPSLASAPFWVASALLLLSLLLQTLAAGPLKTPRRPTRSLILGPLLGIFLAVATAPLHAQPLPQGVKAWLAQRALEGGDLPTAQRWKPAPDRPERALLRAAIELRSGFPSEALKSLESLTGQGAPRPLPGWRPRALLLAARCQIEQNQPDAARALLERLLLEAPGTDEAAHDLQSLVKDPAPPPPPDPKKPPPPPPPRPSMGAQQDELEGIKQRLPRPNPPPGGVKDL